MAGIRSRGRGGLFRAIWRTSRRSCSAPWRSFIIVKLSGTSGVFVIGDETSVHTPPPNPSRSDEFTAFMHAYQDMVFSTAARLLGNDAQAEDIAQEVFIKAYERFEELRSSPTAGGWLKTVATNMTLNHLSRYRARWRFFSELPRDEEHDDPPELTYPTPDTAVMGIEAEERRAVVENALRRLPEHQRVPLVLYHFEDMPYQDIAKRLRVSLGKVKTDIRRGRMALADSLRQT
jgi:RNA polymerase sigma-70 factor, ECF subfamily